MSASPYRGSLPAVSPPPPDRRTRNNVLLAMGCTLLGAILSHLADAGVSWANGTPDETTPTLVRPARRIIGPRYLDIEVSPSGTATEDLHAPSVLYPDPAADPDPDPDPDPAP